MTNDVSGSKRVSATLRECNSLDNKLLLSPRCAIPAEGYGHEDGIALGSNAEMTFRSKVTYQLVTNLLVRGFDDLYSHAFEPDNIIN